MMEQNATQGSNKITTQAFEICTGLRQGCILLPFLPTIVIDYLLCIQDGKGYHMMRARLFNMDFADDIAILETSN